MKRPAPTFVEYVSPAERKHTRQKDVGFVIQPKYDLGRTLIHYNVALGDETTGRCADCAILLQYT